MLNCTHLDMHVCIVYYCSRTLARIYLSDAAQWHHTSSPLRTGWMASHSLFRLCNPRGSKGSSPTESHQRPQQSRVITAHHTLHHQRPQRSRVASAASKRPRPVHASPPLACSVWMACAVDENPPLVPASTHAPHTCAATASKSWAVRSR
jgi:hypothetical protein